MGWLRKSASAWTKGATLGTSKDFSGPGRTKGIPYKFGASAPTTTYQPFAAPAVREAGLPTAVGGTGLARPEPSPFIKSISPFGV